MRSVRSLFLIAIAIAGVFAIAVPAQSGSIDNQVYHKIRGLTYYNTFDYITWQVNGSTVTLSGKTLTLGTKSEIAHAVKEALLASDLRVLNVLVHVEPDEEVRA